MVYAYALEAVEQEAKAVGASIIDARDAFHRRFMTEEEAPVEDSPVKVREQAQAQQELMAAMSRGARG